VLLMRMDLPFGGTTPRQRKVFRPDGSAVASRRARG
jgi:hypothetical protein